MIQKTTITYKISAIINLKTAITYKKCTMPSKSCAIRFQISTMRSKSSAIIFGYSFREVQETQMRCEKHKTESKKCKYIRVLNLNKKS